MTKTRRNKKVQRVLVMREYDFELLNKAMDWWLMIDEKARECIFEEWIVSYYLERAPYMIKEQRRYEAYAKKIKK